MLDRIKSLLLEVAGHHTGIESREVIMHQIKALLESAQGLRTLLQTDYRLKPKAPGLLDAVCRFYENGLILSKKLRNPWFSRKTSKELIEMLDAFNDEFERFQYYDLYETSALNADFSQRMTMRLTRIIGFLIKIS